MSGKPFLRQVGGVVYRTATPADSDAIGQLMLSDFCRRMPLYRHVGATTAADVEVSLGLLPAIVEQGVSIVAEDPDGGELLGVRLSALEQPPPEKHPLMVDADLAARYPKEGVVMRLIDRLLVASDYFQRYGTERALAARFLAVRESHGRRGIGRLLMESSVQLARDLGLGLIVGATQNCYSERIYESLKFERVATVSIADFVDPLTGGKPFAGLAGSVHKEAVFFAKRL